MTDDPNAPPHPSERADETAAGGRQSLARQRDDRRKAALKANMARRKAAVRGRQQAADADANADAPQDPITRTE